MSGSLKHGSELPDFTVNNDNGFKLLFDALFLTLQSSAIITQKLQLLKSMGYILVKCLSFYIFTIQKKIGLINHKLFCHNFFIGSYFNKVNTGRVLLQVKLFCD
jgi:hypothetical protein